MSRISHYSFIQPPNKNDWRISVAKAVDPTKIKVWKNKRVQTLPTGQRFIFPKDASLRQNSILIKKAVKVPKPPSTLKFKIFHWVFSVIRDMPGPIGLFVSSPLVKEVLGIPGLIAGTLSSGTAVIRKGYAYHTQKQWMNRHKEMDAPTVIREPQSREASQIIEGLLQKRKAAFEQRAESRRTHFMGQLEEIRASQLPYDEMKTRFHRLGINIDHLLREKSGTLPPELMKSPLEDKVKTLLVEELIRDSLLKKHVEHQETMAFYTRNTLKAFSTAKQKTERSFFKFNLTRESVRFGGSLIISVALIAVKVLLIAGVVAIPATLAVSLGGSLFALGVVLLATGIIYMALKKPETLKNTLTNIQLQFARIPGRYYAWRLKRTVGKIEQLDKKYPHPWRVYDPAFRKKQAKLLTDFDSVSRRDVYWQGVIQPLKHTMVEAGWKDFVKHNPQFVDIDTNWDYCKDMASSILDPEQGMLHDPEIVGILKERLGIDPELLESAADNPDLMGEMAFAIRQFSALNSTQMEKMIMTQLKRLQKEEEISQ